MSDGANMIQQVIVHPRVDPWAGRWTKNRWDGWDCGRLRLVPDDTDVRLIVFDARAVGVVRFDARFGSLTPVEVIAAAVHEALRQAAVVEVVMPRPTSRFRVLIDSRLSGERLHAGGEVPGIEEIRFVSPAGDQAEVDLVAVDALEAAQVAVRCFDNGRLAGVVRP